MIDNIQEAEVQATDNYDYDLLLSEEKEGLSVSELGSTLFFAEKMAEEEEQGLTEYTPHHTEEETNYERLPLDRGIPAFEQYVLNLCQ